MKVRNPRTGEIDYEIAPLDEAAIADEANRLRAAQSGWAKKTPVERGEILTQWADTIEANLNEIIPLILS